MVPFFIEFMSGLANQISYGAVFYEVTPKPSGARPSGLSQCPSHAGRFSIVRNYAYEEPGRDKKIFQPPDQIQCEPQKKTEANSLEV